MIFIIDVRVKFNFDNIGNLIEINFKYLGDREFDNFYKKFKN